MGGLGTHGPLICKVSACFFLFTIVPFAQSVLFVPFAKSVLFITFAKSVLFVQYAKTVLFILLHVGAIRPI